MLLQIDSILDEFRELGVTPFKFSAEASIIILRCIMLLIMHLSLSSLNCILNHDIFPYCFNGAEHCSSLPVLKCCISVLVQWWQHSNPGMSQETLDSTYMMSSMGQLMVFTCH